MIVCNMSRTVSASLHVFRWLSSSRMACVVRIFGHLMYFLPFYPLMQQAKEESLVAMQCLQSELEAVRECLREREVELEVARLSLADRDANLAGLQGQWGRKEAELHQVRMRGDGVGGWKSLVKRE